MHSFTTFFLCALASCILWQESFAKGQSGYICLIDDPKQNQCDSYCLTELSPRLSEVVKAQNEGNTKLETLEVKIGGEQAKLPQEVHDKLEGRLQGVEANLKEQLQEVQTKLEAILDESLFAVQKRIETRLQAVVNQLQAVQKKIGAAEVKSQLQAKSNKTAVPQQTAKGGVPASSTIRIPPGFQLIGTRYFRIIEKWLPWDDAERLCYRMGGYLASLRNAEEINAIKPKLDRNEHYWLGINDRENEGHFVSVALHKPAPFLKWAKGQPSDRNHKENCVYLKGRTMYDGNCNKDFFFICQADNET